MADRLTVARPYAKAAFTQAQAAGTLGTWSEVLGKAALAVTDPRVKALFGSPKVTDAQLAQLVSGVSGAGGYAHNFIALLAENGRLPFLPEIAQLFDQLKADAEGVIEVQIISAAPMADKEQGELTGALAKRFGRKVNVHTGVDPALIGGAIVRAGDLTIDGSLKSRLERLALDLSA
ncbi:MAG: F0F1 ATP synthase subunit delta [Nevskiaceae bacterium]|jgi:F-type H+-transporting ATPase subunit delta|nr:F0F1 ATP synthase subunit delta [Nevskiaceae bacterium]